MAKTNRFVKNHPPVEFDPTELLRSGRIPEKTEEIEPIEEEANPDVHMAPVVKTPAPSVTAAEDPVVETTPVVEPAKSEHSPAPEAPKTAIEDLFAAVEDAKPTGKPKTFYMDAEVLDVLEKLAKKKKWSVSKVLNTVLRSTLLGK